MRSRLGRVAPWRLVSTRVGSGVAAGLGWLGIDVATTVCYAAAPAATAASSVPPAFSLSTWPGTDAQRPPGGPDALAADDALVGATLDGDLVGYCVLSDRSEAVGDRVWTLDGGLTLWDLYVEPAYRGRGLGAALLREARASRAVECAGAVTALVDTDNSASRRAFRAAGFRPTERLLSVGWGERRYHRRTPLERGTRP